MAKPDPRLRVMHIISGDLWAGAEVQAYTLLSQLRHYCELQIVLMNSGRLADELSALDISIIVLDESRIGSFQIIRALREAMNRFQPDIVHTHRQKENILGSIANLTSVRAKCLRTTHGAPEFSVGGLQRIQRDVDRLVGRYLQQAIIAVSADLGQQLAAHFPPSHIHIIHNGVDSDVLRKSAVGTADFRQTQPDSLHIGILGRLEPVKRVDLFLKMIPLLRSQRPDLSLRFHVIGEGRLRSSLEAMAQSLDVKEQVHFHGHRPDIPACICALDAVIMCSDHEGTPMAALETLALGTPLIAHDTGGLSEILQSHPDFLVQEHNEHGYARAVMNWLQRPEGENPVLGLDYEASHNARRTASLYRRLNQV
ncbi:glycosyltransferase involved in cell wall biosynthesis [Marinimicrobium koreense]|uniref:Glycosyltransferase involved in cell wall biosynthesis n=1 Tax=Marinimicrobium koreense TaxID=306545 RepID=A0A3N1NPK1_9GAMM|nr:glycosyltransferase [Marinimicrobium koreense]ROQ18073.1 glycosyltransferase involved in cell wall biosynthesis [Marinimicrobium koreense]